MKKKLLKIAIVGKTNAGKSTLINSLIGEIISIINKKINTTEDLIQGILNIENNQLIFYDTPGIIHLTKKYKVKNKLKSNLWAGLNNCDLILYLIDSRYLKLNEIKNYIKKINELNKEIIIVFNKNDIIDKKVILPVIQELKKIKNINTFFSISAKKKSGTTSLKKYLFKKAYFSNWEYQNNEISNKDDIFISNECTRNSVLDFLHKEIPYNIKIKNILFKYLKNGDLKIKQEINIMNERYKKIILGKKGEKIKKIRVNSQKKLTKILNNRVHLYINVMKNNADQI